ncbi:AlpA family transcriptional regulator [Streptomyces sp. NK08204]|uniref:helix-turn-helix transcriptional regulator n=1 Tax=Streptomyces sp. NK08204 TaxID=2873260 RepID=UPI001CEDAB3B|nr:helix-turn-helix domain-containing protein [Streptomyces sp. NK08204]
MPKSPDSEGVPRLMTVSEIAQEHGVSRQTVHSHRRRGAFPKPVEGEGSTRPRFRADEVAAFFAANPKQPGKRRSSPPEQQGEAVSTTVDPRIAILSALNDPPYNEVAEKRCVPWDEAVKMLNAYRAAVLREAAAHLDKVHDYPSGSAEATGAYLSGMENAANLLRRTADEPEASDG